MIRLIDVLKVLPYDKNLRIIDYDSEATLYNGTYTFMPTETLIKLSDKKVLLVNTTETGSDMYIYVL